LGKNSNPEKGRMKQELTLDTVLVDCGGENSKRKNTTSWGKNIYRESVNRGGKGKGGLREDKAVREKGQKQATQSGRGECLRSLNNANKRNGRNQIARSEKRRKRNEIEQQKPRRVSC